MRFLVDAQLPPALTAWLKSRGHEADHVFDLLDRTAEDDEIWALACRLDAALLTKDEDFVTIRRRSVAGSHVVWHRIGNATNPTLLAWLEPRLESIVDAMAATDVIEVR